MNNAVRAFQYWENRVLLGSDEDAVRIAIRRFQGANKEWLAALRAMQANADKHVGVQQTPRKKQGGQGGGGTDTLALPHLQSISASLQSLVELKALVRSTSVSDASPILTTL